MRHRTRENKYPEGESPADKMERLATVLQDLSQDVKTLAASLREDTDAQRADLRDSLRGS